jgi:hypothetical protein
MPFDMASCGDNSRSGNIAGRIVYSGCNEFSTPRNVFRSKRLPKSGVFARQTRNDSFKRSQPTEIQ